MRFYFGGVGGMKMKMRLCRSDRLVIEHKEGITKLIDPGGELEIAMFLELVSSGKLLGRLGLSVSLLSRLLVMCRFSCRE